MVVSYITMQSDDHTGGDTQCSHIVRSKSGVNSRCNRRAKGGYDTCARHTSKSKSRSGSKSESMSRFMSGQMSVNSQEAGQTDVLSVIDPELEEEEGQESDSQSRGQISDVNGDTDTVNADSVIAAPISSRKVTTSRRYNTSAADPVKSYIFECIDEYLERHQRRMSVLGGVSLNSGGQKSSSFNLESILGIGAVSLMPILAKKFMSMSSQSFTSPSSSQSFTSPSSSQSPYIVNSHQPSNHATHNHGTTNSSGWTSQGIFEGTSNDIGQVITPASSSSTQNAENTPTKPLRI